MSYLNPASKHISSVQTRFGLILAALVFAVVFAPASAWAVQTTKDCPTEPAQNVPIKSGETYYGANCVLNTTGDVDSFTFSGSAGQTWTMAMVGLGNPTGLYNACLSLYAPGATTAMFSGCTYYGYQNGLPGFNTAQALTLTGTYTILIQETRDGAVPYALSLERLSPPPTDGVALTLSKNVTAQIGSPAAFNAYTFYGATTGTYEIAASLTSPIGLDNVCLDVLNSAAVSQTSGCTYYGYQNGSSNVSLSFTPGQDGTYVVLVWGMYDYDSPAYELEVSCYLGTCKPPPPVTACTDALSYDSTTGKLTMDFTIGNPVAVTWYAWLVSGNTTKLLWSKSEPAHEPTVSKPESESDVAEQGKIGVLSTLNTPTAGITCSSWVTINTGGS